YRTLNGRVGTNDGFPIPYEMNAIESPALFNLENDPSETRDVAADHPEMVEKITKIADSIRAVLGDRIKGIEGKEVRPVGRVD
ncbi:MAG: arylsulfatase, partial [Flavobacteriia bacterium]|nr:arylsulfatase [Flavobacteriia bacterium]